MTNIDYLKQDTQVGDIVIIELTSGKSVSGKLIEIGDYIIIEKEDGKRLRLLDGIIGGWEVLSHMRGDRKLNDYTHSNVDIKEEKDNNVVAKDNSDGEKNEQINTDTNDGEDEYDDSEEEETYISEIAAAIKEDSSIGYSISYTKDEVREAFKEILNKANIDDTTFTPTNATITSIDSKSLHILARLDNGNVVRFTKSTLVGFNLIRDNLVGSRLFCTSSGATESIINSKRNIAYMSYGQLRVIFLTALEQVNFTLLRRICRTMNKFPNLGCFVSIFIKIYSLLMKLRTLRSIQLCDSSLSESQKSEVHVFISSLLIENPELAHDGSTIRSYVLSQLGIKVSKAYALYVLSKNSSIVQDGRIMNSLSPGSINEEETVIKKDIDSNQTIKQQSTSDIKAESLVKYMQMIKASSLKPNMMIMTNATYSGSSEYPSDLGKADLDNGGEVFIRRMGFVGKDGEQLQVGSRFYVRFRQYTGDSVTSIRSMSYNELNQRYAASIKTESYWEAMSILTYMLHSVPELDGFKDTIRQILTKLTILTQDRYANSTTQSLSHEELTWVESFIKYIVNNETHKTPFTDEQIRDYFLRRFDILLPIEIVSSTRERMGIGDVETRKENYEKSLNENRKKINENNTAEIIQEIEKVFDSIGINLDSTIRTNATLQKGEIGAGVKAITDQGQELRIHSEFYIGNPVSLFSGNKRVFTKPQESGQCYITIEEMSYKDLLDYCKDKLLNGKYQEIINIVKALRSFPEFNDQDEALKLLYTTVKKVIKKNVKKSIKSYEDLSEDEIAIVTSFVKESIKNEDPNNPMTDFELVNSYSNKYDVLLDTSVIKTIRGDLDILTSVERRIAFAPIFIESNCLIDKYFMWYNNGAARNSSYQEIRFKDDVVDPVLLTELKNYRKGDSPIPAVCGVITEGRYTNATFIIRPGYSDVLLQTAKYFESAGNYNTAKAIKNYIEQKAEKSSQSKDAMSQLNYTRARELRKSHDYLKAEAILLNLISSNYQLDTVVKDLADMYREMGDMKKALELMEKYVESMTNKQKAYNFISNLYTAVGDYEKSVSFLKKGLSFIDKTDKSLRVRSLINIANQLILLQDTDGAKEVLREALKIQFNPKAKDLYDKLDKEKKSGIGKLTRVLSFKAPVLLEYDLRLSNYQEFSDEATEHLLRAKRYQEEQDYVKCKKHLLAYATTRYIDLLKSDKVNSAQEYMLSAQAINNTAVDTSGMLLLLSQINADPIELSEKDISKDFASFLSTYSPTADCERVFYSFIRCFAENVTPSILNTIYENINWKNWVWGLIGHDISDKRVFRDTLLKKAEQFETPYNKICSTLTEVKQLDSSYDMSKKVISLFAMDNLNCINNEDKDALSDLSELVQQLNEIQKLDDYQVVEERTSAFIKKIKNLTKKYESEPTRLTLIYILPVLEKCQYLANDNIEKLGREKAPNLNIVASSNARICNNNCNIQLKIANKVGCSKIVSASVRIISVNDIDTTDKQYIYNIRTPLYGGDSHTFEISINSNQCDKELKVLKLSIQIIYFDKDSTDYTTQRLIETRIDDSHIFKPFKNEFLKYANGQEVVEYKMVKGRDSLICDIAEKALNDRKSYIIHGQRRSGKSTVLLHVGNRLKENKKCFVVSMSMLSLSGEDNPIVNEQSFLGDLYYEILSKISRQIKLENKNVYKDIFGYGLDCKDFLSNPNTMFTNYLYKIKDVIHEELGYKDDRIILIIDEFTALYSEILAGTISDTFIKKMKELSESGSITFILSGHDVMPIFWERFPNEFGIFKKELITSIDEQSARELVEEPVWDTDNNSSRFESDAVSRIIELSGCSPFYIQIICAEIVEYANQNRISIITEFDVNKVINRMTSSEAKLRRGDFDNLVPVGENKMFHERVFGLSLDDVMILLKEISQNNQEFVPVSSLHSIHTNERNKVLSYLISRNVLEEHPEYGREMVKIKVSLFKEWIRKNEQ